MYGLLIALTLAAGCATGTETGKDGELTDGFGEPLPCADSYATADRENGIPLAFACEEAAGTGDGDYWLCPVAGAKIYADRVEVGCPTGAKVYLRWL